MLEYDPVVPKKLGSYKIKRISLSALADYIDWSPLFHAWELSGVYPKIFKHPTKGAEAKKVFDDAPEPKEGLFIPNAGHNNLFDFYADEKILVYLDKQLNF